jgi:hypothetical protein
LPTDSFTNTYTERAENNIDNVTAGSNGFISLSHQMGGTRGDSHEISKADDGTSNSLGAQEWSGIETSPTIASAVADGTGTAPTAAVTVSAASLVVMVVGYAGTTTTMAASDGTEAQEVDEDSTNQAHAVYYKVAQTGTPSITSSLGASRDWGAIIGAFTEAGGGGGRVTKNTRPSPLGMAIGMGWQVDIGDVA